MWYFCDYIDTCFQSKPAVRVAGLRGVGSKCSCCSLLPLNENVFSLTAVADAELKAHSDVTWPQ